MCDNCMVFAGEEWWQTIVSDFLTTETQITSLVSGIEIVMFDGALFHVKLVLCV